MTPEAQLIEAAQAIVSALTDHPDLVKRAGKLRRLELKAEAMKPPGRPAGNVYSIGNRRNLAEPTEAERRRTAIAALIVAAVQAERDALYASSRSASHG